MNRHRQTIFGCITAALLGTAACDKSPKGAAGARHEQAPDQTSEVRSQRSDGTLASDFRPPTIDVRSQTSDLDAECARLLTEIVDDNGLVHYELLRDPASAPAKRLALVRAGYAALPAPTDEKSRKAALINTYNLNVIALVASGLADPAFKNLQDPPGFFDKGGVTTFLGDQTLNSLKQVIRAMGDPRIHGALCDGARGSPALRREPYTAAQLDQQLDDQCAIWLDDWGRNRVLRNTLGLSEIFKRYEEDFKAEPYHDVIGFVRRFSRPRGAVRDFLVSMKDDAKITYLEFDWRPNQALAEPRSGSAKTQPAAPSTPMSETTPPIEPNLR